MNEMTSDITLSKLTITDLSGVYSIPSYQRGYRWTEAEITALLNDLAEYAESGNSDGYCIQSIVLQSVKDSDGRIVEGKYLVVDGQQCLTTLYIILRILNCGVRWDIEYTTEKNKRLSESLRNPGSSISDHFRLEAFKVAKTWSERNVEAARKVQCLLSSGNVFFLRYLISPDEEGARMACDNERGVKFLGMKPLKVVRLKIGKDGSASYNFSPSVRGLPKEFLILPDVAWRDATDEDIRGALRRYVAALREKGESVTLSVADSGVVRFDLTLDGESRSLWFNARTSDTVVLDADGNVCKNIREAIQGSSV